jgi:non-heme chloroperoxidase
MMKTLCFLTLASLAVAGAPARAVAPVGDSVPTVGEVRIHYLEAGRADARHTLLLIPGWLTSSSIWSKQLDYFSARGYRVVAIDSRSQGGSSVVETGNAPEDRAEDIHQVISKLHLAHVILVGWSQGVQDVAAYVSRFNADTVDGFALIDSPVSAGPDDVKENPVFVQAVLQHMAVYSRDPGAYADGFMHAIISIPAAAATFRQLDREFTLTPPDIGISMQIQDLFTTDRRPSLKRFNKPTLVVASGKSPLLDAKRQMATALPGGQFAVITDAAHAVFFDQPKEFNRLLETFVTGLDRPRILAPATP